jgi:periplasmic divalent cation tolerance protein
MRQMGMAVVLITASSQAEAEKIASVLLESKKAACVNMVSDVHSRFWWQGKIDSAGEALLIVKTKASAVPDIVDLVKKNHSYSLPEIIALPIIAGNEGYLNWIDESVE